MQEGETVAHRESGRAAAHQERRQGVEGRRPIAQPIALDVSGKTGSIVEIARD
jgi:hypothetical protein